MYSAQKETDEQTVDLICGAERQKRGNPQPDAEVTGIGLRTADEVKHAEHMTRG